MAEDMTPKPTIDPESPTSSLLRKMRQTEMAKRISKYGKKDYAKMYRVMKKYRTRQMDLLKDDDIEDPDPYVSTYVFHCFTGKLED